MLSEECCSVTAKFEAQDEDDQDEDEQEIQVNSNGSVLMPSDSPYDKYIKIKEANDELFTTIITKPRSPRKVRFSSEIVTHSVEYEELFEENILTEIAEGTYEEEDIDINSSTDSSSSSSTIICKPSKVLLVTVPTAFTKQVYDDEYEEGEGVDEDDKDEEEEEEEDEDEDDDEYGEADTVDETEIAEEDVIDDIENVSVVGNVSDDDDDSEGDKSNVNGDKMVVEEEEIVEDLTEELEMSAATPSPINNHTYRHKRILTKNSRVEEYSDEDDANNSAEDANNNADCIDSNVSELNEDVDTYNGSIEELTQNFNDIKISTELEETDNEIEELDEKKKSGKNKVVSEIVDSLQNNENKINRDYKRRNRKNISNRNINNNNNNLNASSVPINIRAQCPIFKRTQGYMAQVRQHLSMKKNKNKDDECRPSSAPAKRHCCNYWDQKKLPNYNGLRSEYGLTAEQISQRKREKHEITKTIRVEKEKKYLEELKKQKENDIIFNSWLVKKKKEAAQKFSRRQLQSTFQLKTIAAPTKHLEKVGALRKKLLKREQTSYSLEEFFKNANPHEQKTYRIYLGLCVE